MIQGDKNSRKRGLGVKKILPQGMPLSIKTGSNPERIRKVDDPIAIGSATDDYDEENEQSFGL